MALVNAGSFNRPKSHFHQWQCSSTESGCVYVLLCGLGSGICHIVLYILLLGHKESRGGAAGGGKQLNLVIHIYANDITGRNQ